MASRVNSAYVAIVCADFEAKREVNNAFAGRLMDYPELAGVYADWVTGGAQVGTLTSDNLEFAPSLRDIVAQ
jgi:hypothetical protein